MKTVKNSYKFILVGGLMLSNYLSAQEAPFYLNIQPSQSHTQTNIILVAKDQGVVVNDVTVNRGNCKLIPFPTNTIVLEKARTFDEYYEIAATRGRLNTLSMQFPVRHRWEATCGANVDQQPDECGIEAYSYASYPFSPVNFGESQTIARVPNSCRILEVEVDTNKGGWRFDITR